MGFIDNATSNILIDAVLTDVGRQFLARNDGSFSIIKFAASDDECNYNLIRQFGRTVGKEKIAKNTPIMEAQTVGALAQKYRLVSLSNPNLIRMPNITLVTGGTSNIVTMGRNLEKTKTVKFEQQIQNETEINPELRDQVFLVELSNLFLRVVNVEPDNVDGQQRATYVLTRDAATTALQGSSITFTLAVQSITDALFDVFGLTATGSTTKNTIKTIVRVTGLASGAVHEITVSISRTG